MIECQCFVCRQARALGAMSFVKKHAPEPLPMWRDVNGVVHRASADKAFIPTRDHEEPGHCDKCGAAPDERWDCCEVHAETAALHENQQTPAGGEWALLRLPTDSAERKRIPMGTGLIDYFPDALAEVAKVSQFGNDKHNPGEPLHHARGKSMDHEDCVMRHYVDRYGVDPASGLDEAAFMCWRALAFYQELLERRNDLPLPRGARPA